MNMLARMAALGFAFAGSSAATAATYAVNAIDYIDPVTSAVAPFTQLWGNNNNGKVIGDASFDPTGATGLFNFVYDPATGIFQPLAPPPGVDPANFGAISINDADEIVGTIFDDSGGAQPFILRGSTYTFFSEPGWPLATSRTISNHTALHPEGLVVGFSAASFDSYVDATGWIYDPVANAFLDIPGSRSPYTIAQGLNIAGQVVGNVYDPVGTPQVSGFLYTPSSSDPMAGGTTTTFNIGGFRTRARGINDHGIIAAAVSDDPANPGATHVYAVTSAGYQLVDIPAATGPACADGGVPMAFPEGLNNSGQITGVLIESGTCRGRGFIATPAYVPNGTTPSGAYTFTVDVVPDTPYFLDPSTAIGYDYQIGKKDPRFASVRLPLGIGDNKFVLVVGHKAYDLSAGQRFDFAAHGYKKGVRAFRVACIDPAAMLDPVNSLAFPTEVTFTGTGTFTGTQQPLTAIKFRGRDLATMSQAECRGRMLGTEDVEGPEPD